MLDRRYAYLMPFQLFNLRCVPSVHELVSCLCYAQYLACCVSIVVATDSMVQEVVPATGRGQWNAVVIATIVCCEDYSACYVCICVA